MKAEVESIWMEVVVTWRKVLSLQVREVIEENHENIRIFFYSYSGMYYQYNGKLGIGIEKRIVILTERVVER
jgi:hypothetical protein